MINIEAYNNLIGFVLFIGPVFIRQYMSLKAYNPLSPIKSQYIKTLQSIFNIKNTNAEKNQAVFFEQRKSYFSYLFASCFPERKQCKVIHIAGTKGKGSTVEYVSSGLIATGNSVGIFTSPHIHTVRERIKYGRKLISINDFIRIANRMKEELDKFNWTVFFDVMLASCLTYFGEQKVNYIVMECGVGGRYSATNFISDPDICIITKISLDHQAVLGNTVEEIAWQKAGIIQPGSVVFTPNTQPTTVLEVFRKECKLVDARLIEVPVNREQLDHQNIPCSYGVQVENACLSIAVLNHLNTSSEGMKHFFWPCRMELFNFNGCRVILDGCHNGESVQLFLSELQSIYPNDKKHVLFGAGQEKCVEDMIQYLYQYADQVTLVQSKNIKSLSEIELLHKLRHCHENNASSSMKYFEVLNGTDRIIGGTVDTRLSTALDNCVSNEVIAVCGSLFVAAEAREYLFKRYGPKYFTQGDWVYERDELDD